MQNIRSLVTAAIVIAGPGNPSFRTLAEGLMDARVKPVYDAWNGTGGSATMTPLQKVNSMKMPFAELKGVTFTEAGSDRVVARMLVRPDLCTLNHTIHGGAVMALADSVGAAATVINLPDNANGTTTIESKTNFIGGANEGMTVIATATPVHRGRRTQVWQTRIETEEGKLVAVVTQTQMVL
jgi:uncharacterized protein (TIGR00369 family)